MHMLVSALTGWLIVVTAFDFSSRRVPNWLVVSGLLMGVGSLTAGLHPFGVSPTSALLASLLIFGVFLIFYATGLMGGGDVKFAAVLGLWLGHEWLVQAVVLGSLLAGLHALVVLLRQSSRLMQCLPRTIAPGPDGCHQKNTKRRQIPYAAYLSIGGLMTFI